MIKMFRVKLWVNGLLFEFESSYFDLNNKIEVILDEYGYIDEYIERIEVYENE